MAAPFLASVPYLSTATKVVFGGAGAYLSFLVALVLFPSFQREVLYLHNIKVLWLRDPKHPKAIGFRGKWKSLFEPLTTTDHFQEGQVVPFELHTRDGETLFAWHVVPASNELSRDAVKLQDGQEEALRRLKSRGVRLFVFFHGNASHVSQGARPTLIKNLLQSGEGNAQVLTFDYRGFGYSTGAPSEDGLIIDGVSAVTWAIEQGGVSPRNIVLIGHSLGTAVSTAVYHHFSTQGKPLGGLALIAPFTNVPKLTTTYRVGGIVPLLQPLALFPAVQTWGTSQVRDKWQTELRLAEVAASGQGHKITIFHARSDFAIPCHHALSLYQTLCSGKAEWRPVDPPGFEASKSTTASGKTLWTASQQSANGSEFRLFLFRQGFHNGLVKFPDTARATAEML